MLMKLTVPMATWLAFQNRLKMDALLKGKSGNEIIDADCVECLKMQTIFLSVCDDSFHPGKLQGGNGLLVTPVLNL